jgi:argininosuccinate lyase
MVTVIREPTMAEPIWSKRGETAATPVHAFTVGDDWRYDRVLAPYDLLGSIAHAQMLGETGIIPAGPAATLVDGLRRLHADFTAGAWTVDADDEDMHSKIEALLAARLGDVAGDLHTGRSRNDQVLTALRLWQKDQLAGLARTAAATATALLEQARRHEFAPLPGYTHLQRAMPSSLGMFFGGHAQGLIESDLLLDAAWRLADRCPLGSGAGYGVPLPLNRDLPADLLGFDRRGAIAMADANSRGKVDTACLDAAGALLGDLSRLAANVIFFTSAECGFFGLAPGFTTGSSIMPQKRNPDVFELLRGRCATFLGLRTGLTAVTIGLPSGYSRDLQETKALVMDGLRLAHGCVTIAAAAVPGIIVHPDRIAAALTPDLYATAAAYERMRRTGGSFRASYRHVGAHLDEVKAPADPAASLRARTHAGATGDLGLADLDSQAAAMAAAWAGRQDRLRMIWRRLLDG